MPQSSADQEAERLRAAKASLEQQLQDLRRRLTVAEDDASSRKTSLDRLSAECEAFRLGSLSVFRFFLPPPPLSLSLSLSLPRSLSFSPPPHPTLPLSGTTRTLRHCAAPVDNTDVPERLSEALGDPVMGVTTCCREALL